MRCLIFIFLGSIFASEPIKARSLDPVSIASPLDRQAVAIGLAKGTEGMVLHVEKLFGQEWVYVHFITGENAGRRGWLPFRQKNTRVRFYAIEKHQAFQTLDIKKARYARIAELTQGYLDFSFNLGKAASSIDDLKPYTIDFFDKFPRTNFGILELTLTSEMKRACPLRPTQRNGSPCLEAPEKFKLPPHLRKLVRNASRDEGVHPAIVAAILQKESYFNPFSENQYEKKLCLSQGKECPAYRWGQGLAQLGATNAAEFGLSWQAKITKPRACGKRHIFDPACFTALESKCAKVKKATGKYPTYCAEAGVRAVAKYVASLIGRDLWMRVDVKSANGVWTEKVINLTNEMRRTLAEEFRYVLGMYNRGKRPVNSIEEHFRQFGRAPEWYDHAWLTARVEGATPTTQMGYLILNNEVINRCHVWQVAGLCGEDLQGTLAGAYLADFPDKKTKRREIAGIAATPRDLYLDPDMNIDESLLSSEDE
jgi:hypothetical protein